MPDKARNPRTRLLVVGAWFGAWLIAPGALGAEPDAQPAARQALPGVAAPQAARPQPKLSPYAKANRERLAAGNAAQGPHLRSRKGPNHARRP